MIYVIDVLDQPGVAFAERFKRFLEFEQISLDWVLIDAITETDKLENLLEQRPAGILISGSVRGVYDDLPWIKPLEAFIRRVHQADIPLFGICFGHQLLAQALGGRSGKAPNWEFGSLPVYLYPDVQHPCLEGVESGVITLQTHQDIVWELPPGAKALGFSRQTAYQIFSLGSALGIQYHPEYTREDLQEMAPTRVDRYLETGAFQTQEHVLAYAAAMAPADASRRILRNFLLNPECLCTSEL